jgi:hypothetical protein
VDLVAVDPPTAIGSLALVAPAPNPTSDEMNYSVLLPREAA